MHYLYILEGRLKYETISFESSVTFNLYSSDTEVKTESANDDLIYFLKSEINVAITVNLESNKIFLSAPIDQSIVLLNSAGKAREISADREISIADNIVKFRIADVDFAFLINSKIDPEGDKLSSIENKRKNASRFSIGSLTNLTPTGKIVAAVVVLIILSIGVYWGWARKQSKIVHPIIVFDNEYELMRANLSNLNSKEILVKTQLEEQVKLYLEQQGYRYVQFELEKQKNEKFNLNLYVFQNDKQPFDTIVNQFSWINNVVVKMIDVRDMFNDYNILAEKYQLKGIRNFNADMKYKLVEVTFVNNNLKFDSLQRDLTAFQERWGTNYIEFNVNLKIQRDIQVDFILKDGDESVIKSDDMIYIN